VKTLSQVYLGNPLWAWLAAGLMVALTISLAALAGRLLRRRLQKRREGRVPPDLLHSVAGRTSVLLLIGFSLLPAGLILTLPEKLEQLIRVVAVSSLALEVALWLHGLIGFVTDQAVARVSARDPGASTMIRALGVAGDALLWAVMLLLALHNIGVNVSALVAGLGIGGVAVALAVQSILSDLFASIAIMLDKPYQVGDFIAVGDSMGTVERIGIKTTRVRSLSGEQLVFANSELLKSRIRNFKRMSERRVEFTIGVAYSTPHAKVEQIPSILRDIIGAREQLRLERAHFKEIGESSLTCECVYFVRDSDYSVYLGTQEAINLEILRRFQEEEIELAQPNRMLYQAQGVAPVRW
jgi:small-conductance mechanosensitive channel